MATSPVFAEIAGGRVDSTGATPGDKLQGAQGCTVLAGSTGLIQITLDPPNNGIPATEVLFQHWPGDGSSKSPGGLSTSFASGSGSFVVSIWDQTVVPPALINGPIGFLVKRKYPDR